MRRRPTVRPPPWVNRHLPRAQLHQPRGQRARVPPVDYGDGLHRLTPNENTEFSKCT
jgi:hypothetical protein